MSNRGDMPINKDVHMSCVDVRFARPKRLVGFL